MNFHYISARIAQLITNDDNVKQFVQTLMDRGFHVTDAPARALKYDIKSILLKFVSVGYFISDQSCQRSTASLCCICFAPQLCGDKSSAQLEITSYSRGLSC